ncbi:MAG: hypothetical protein HS132_02450 [Planctomycetia bacterium]|nr:hypothetical protein [Planctomycetia bacterium]
MNNLERKYREKEDTLTALYTTAREKEVVVLLADGREKSCPFFRSSASMHQIKWGFCQNEFLYSKVLGIYMGELREANTEGGSSRNFGTVMLVLIMSIAVVPLGVLTAVYLKEYARDSFIARLVRISVSNLAGVPSIVFGVFGLGFFIYFIGGV